MTQKFLLTIMLVTIPLARAVEAEDLAQGAAATVEEFHRALSSQDKAKVLALLAPDVLIFESGGAEVSRDEYAGHHLGADMEFSAATKQTVTDQQTGQEGDVAWVLTRSATNGTFRDKEVHNLGVETMMLKQTIGSWRIFHIHWSSRLKRAD